MDLMLLRSKWDEILENIKKEYEITDMAFKTWLNPLSVSDLKDSVVYINVPSEKFIYFLSQRFELPLIVAISETLGYECEVVFKVSGNSLSEKKIIYSKPNKCINGLNPRYTFDTFVVGNNNKFAHAASLAVAEAPGEVYNPLFLYGGVGLGKTHLMHSIAHFIAEHRPETNILYVTSEQFTNEVIEAIRNGSNTAISKFREKYRNIDVLLVDDVQFIIGKESTQEEFFHTFNSLHAAGKQIVLSSDRPPKDMDILEERIRSRFEWGLMADIQSPDYETRIAILQKKQENDGYFVKKEVIEYIASNVKANIRELEGSLNKIIALAKTENREADLELAEKALQDIISPYKNVVITPELIVSRVSEYFNIPESDLKGQRRTGKISSARQICMYLIREMTDEKLENIGVLFGGKDHSTVIYSVKKLETTLETSEETRKTIDNLKTFIAKNEKQ